MSSIALIRIIVVTIVALVLSTHSLPVHSQCPADNTTEKKMQVYDITDYGAIADGSTDCRPAMSKLLEDLGNSENATIIFPKGNYYLETGIYPGHTGSFGSLFNISQLKNLTIDGKGSELIFGGIKGVFHFTGCENVRIQDFSIDWKRPPFSVGEVVSSEDGSFVVEVFDEYPVEGG